MTQLRTEVDGRALARAFNRLPASIRRNVTREVTTAARQVANVARGLLRSGGRSGAVLGAGGRGRKKRASAPGEPPARRTGTLARSIKVVNPKSRGDRIARDVRAQIAYSMALEHGRKSGGRIEPRPFLKPAREREQGNVFRGVSNALRSALVEFEQAR